MPKHYKEMMDEIINKMEEDAPANAVAHGGVDMAPNAGKRDPLSMAKPKKRKDLEDIKKSLGLKIKEDNDNNNVVLKSLIENINKMDDRVDELSGFKKEEIKIVEEKKPTFKEKFLDQLANNSPNAEQFDNIEIDEKL